MLMMSQKDDSGERKLVVPKRSLPVLACRSDVRSLRDLSMERESSPHGTVAVSLCSVHQHKTCLGLNTQKQKFVWRLNIITQCHAVCAYSFSSFRAVCGALGSRPKCTC